MRILKAFAIAFSTYSKIPMPQFAWNEEDLRYSMCFFPWVGAVEGWLVWLWFQAALVFDINTFTYVLVAAAIPLVVTGGIHVDGYMDTMDAFHSYQSKERKLAILKDAHIGAFSVIMLAVYGLVYLAGFAQITDSGALKVFCCGFFLSRCLSGLGVVLFPSAKKEGLLYTFANASHKRIVTVALFLQTCACILLMFYFSWKAAVFVAAAAGLCMVYYRLRSMKEFGGITGDTAGYFLTVCEGAMVIAAAVAATV